MNPPRFLRHLAALLITGACVSSTELPVNAQTLDLPGTDSEGSLTIGDHLWIRLTASPLTHYKVALLDEFEFEIAAAELSTDPFGQVEPTLLWWRSGVVGCDEEGEANPRLYRFERFEEAEAQLAFRTLRLEVRDARRVVADQMVPLVARKRPRLYTSDAAGCPRASFQEGETVFLSGLHSTEIAEIGVFVVPAQTTWALRDPLTDVRLEQDPQVLDIFHRAQFTEALWSGGRGGPYDVVVRRPPTPEEFLLTNDEILPNRGGLTIHNQDCPRCIDPPGGKVTDR